MEECRSHDPTPEGLLQLSPLFIATGLSVAGLSSFPKETPNLDFYKKLPNF